MLSSTAVREPLTGTADVVVIGGGIIGSSTALFLARAGLSVVLVEKGAGPVEASTRNGGGVRAQCRNGPERLLAMRSQRLWHELAQETGDDFEYILGGNARLAFSEETLDGLRAEQGEELADGLKTEVWDRRRVLAAFPFVSEDVVGAKFCAVDGHANPILATWSLVRAARRSGVHYVPHAHAEAIGTKGGAVESVLVRVGNDRTEIRSSTVVHAAGAWSKGLARGLGIELPLTPARNTMMVTEPQPPLSPVFFSSHEKQVYVRQARKGHLHIGGVFSVPGTFDQAVKAEELHRLARVVELVPSLADVNVLRSWSGTLDHTPDHLPIVGPVAGRPGYVVAAGFSGHGFCIGPAVGESVAALISGGGVPTALMPLSPSRFGVAA